MVRGSAQLLIKTTRNTQGVQVMSLKKGQLVDKVEKLSETKISNIHRFKSKNFPSAGALLRAEDQGEQITF